LQENLRITIPKSRSPAGFLLFGQVGTGWLYRRSAVSSYMPLLHTVIAAIHAFFTSELGRFGATTLVVLFTLLASRLARRYLNRAEALSHSADTKRAKLVWLENALRITAAAAIALIWASKIAGFAFSVAALAGALLLVSKELLMCVMGYAMITLAKPYRIGDFIEIKGNSGRVLNVSAFSTTLTETGSVHQLTGKTLSFPNSVLLSEAVRNMSATGTFIVTLYRMVVPAEIDFDIADRCALEAAELVTAAWREDADRHLELIESSAFLDLPSSKPKVLWESPDVKGHVMNVRFACPMEHRVAAEQEIFREFWRRYRRAVPAPAGPVE
jgi:small-conductance mechanosensitive channel